MPQTDANICRFTRQTYDNPKFRIFVCTYLFFPENVAPICLPSTEELRNSKIEGIGTVTGWGIQFSVLEKIYVPVVPDCQNELKR